MQAMAARATDPGSLRRDIDRLDERTALLASRLEDLRIEVHRGQDLIWQELQRINDRLDAVRIDAARTGETLHENMESLEARVRESMEMLEARLREDADRREARLREDIRDLEARLRENTRDLEGRLRADMQRGFSRIDHIFAGIAALVVAPWLLQWLGPALARAIGLAA